MVNYICPIFCNTNPQSELYTGYKRIMNIDTRRTLQICEIWIRVGENPGGRGCSFFVRVICIEENYSTFISSTGNETSEIFQKLNIRCIWIFRHAKEDLRNCVGVMNYWIRPGKTHCTFTLSQKDCELVRVAETRAIKKKKNKEKQ